MGIGTGVGREIKKTFKSFVDVPSWLGYRSIKHYFKGIKSTGKDYFTPKQSDVTEEFAEAAQRFNLSEEEIQKRQSALLRLSLFYFGLFVVILGYAVFLAFDGVLRGFIIAVVVSLLALANAFRHHFWYFQIKQRKLGCTVKEWYNSAMGGKS